MASVFVVNINGHKNTPKKYLIEKLSLEHFLFVLVIALKILMEGHFLQVMKMQKLLLMLKILPFQLQIHH